MTTATPTPKGTPPMPTNRDTDTTLSGWKAVNPDMTCNGYAFTPGVEHVHDGPVKLCASGFHFCEDPLEVLRYYNARTARFFPVIASGVSPAKGDDSKRVAARITLGT